MYLKLLRKVGDFEIECFTPEESQTIQELLFILDTLPIWAYANDCKTTEYVNSIEQSQAGLTVAINGSEYVKIFQKQNERKVLTDGLILETETFRNGDRAFHIKSALDNGYLFCAMEEKQSFLTVLIFHSGNWTNYLRHIFTKLCSGQNALAISKQSPPWNFQPF